jgi:hypothetical protein
VIPTPTPISLLRVTFPGTTSTVTHVQAPSLSMAQAILRHLDTSYIGTNPSFANPVNPDPHAATTPAFRHVWLGHHHWGR